MTVGRITFRGRKSASGDALKRALDTIRNPAEGVRLVSHGFKKRCEVCERHTHAKWHECARGDINPVALIQYVEGLRGQKGSVIADAVIGYVMAVTGIDETAMRAMLESERAVDAVAKGDEVL